MKKGYQLLCSITFMAMLLTPAWADDQPFTFMALGDTAYKDKRYDDYHGLIDKINRAKPAFTVHVGDTLGYQQCSDETFAKITQSFQRFDAPLIYTPGDNEWTDCYKPGLRSDTNPEGFSQYRLDRLQTLRQLYFSTNQSLGKNTLTLTRQSDVQKEHKEFVENSYWIHQGVLFATVHIVGSNDSFHPYLSTLTKESLRRRKANYDWIMHMIDVAKEHKVKAVVVAGHAELFDDKRAWGSVAQFSGTQARGGKLGPYVGYVHALSKLTQDYPKPILYIHGDYHKFVIDRPLLIHGGNHEPGDLRNTNFTRLQVFGDPEDKAVRVNVDPNSEHVFSFSPF